MSRHRHEIPTHLNVEDKAFYGFSARQVMYVTVGLSGSYALWNQWPGVPLLLRLTLRCDELRAAGGDGTGGDHCRFRRRPQQPDLPHPDSGAGAANRGREVPR